jgi:acetyltransferase-like isoleucine patch superfamily enzyme
MWPRNLAHYVFFAFQYVNQFICTLAMGPVSKWWAVEIGPRCSFVGLPKFHRAPHARIKMGASCRLISSFTANSHGVRTKVFLNACGVGSKIEIGDWCGLSGTIISAADQVRIGDRVQCGANTVISDNDAHGLDYRVRRSELSGVQDASFLSSNPAAPINIGDDVWLGMGVTILKGVTIGPRSVIGAGSVVTRSIPADCVAAGAPAKVIRTFDWKEAGFAPK